MPKLDLTHARSLKGPGGEIARLKGAGFSWQRPSSLLAGQYRTDFGEYASTAAMLEDWSVDFGAANTFLEWTIDSTGLVSDKAMRISHRSATRSPSRFALFTWGAVPPSDDVEVLALLEGVSGSVSGQFAAATNVSGPNGNGVPFGWRNNATDATVREIVNSNWGVWHNTAHGFTRADGEAVWVRGRRVGSQAQIKLWQANEDADLGLSNEPEAWLITDELDAHTDPGNVGLFCWAGSRDPIVTRLHYLAFGLNGVRAPAPELAGGPPSGGGSQPDPDIDPDPTPDMEGLKSDTTRVSADTTQGTANVSGPGDDFPESEPEPAPDPDPDPDFGPELIVNGDFSNGSSGWLTGGWSVSGGFAEHEQNATTAGMTQQIGASLDLGATYRVAWDQERIASGKFIGVRLGNGTQNIETISNAGTGRVEFFVSPTSGGNTFRLAAGLNGHVRVTNISVREVLNGESSPPDPDPEPGPRQPTTYSHPAPEITTLPISPLKNPTNPQWNNTPSVAWSMSPYSDLDNNKADPKLMFMNPISGKAAVLCNTDYKTPIGPNPLNRAFMSAADVWETTDGINFTRGTQQPFFGELVYAWQGHRAMPRGLLRDPRPEGNGRWLMYFTGAGGPNTSQGHERQIGIAISTDDCQTWTIPSSPSILNTTADIASWAPSDPNLNDRVYVTSAVYFDGWFYLYIAAGVSNSYAYGWIRSLDGVTNWEAVPGNPASVLIWSNQVYDNGYFYGLRRAGGNVRMIRSEHPVGPYTEIGGVYTPTHDQGFACLFRLGDGWSSISCTITAFRDQNINQWFTT